MEWGILKRIDTGEKLDRSSYRQSNAGLLLALSCISLLALSLRLYASTDNFWLDEIFTYFIAMEHVSSISDVFFGIKVEHQFLVTLYMYLLGDQPNWIWYRFPSVIMGTGSLALMALAGYRRMRSLALVLALVVTAVSYPLVVYSSEARGYAPAVFFSLAMMVFIESYWRKRNQIWLIGYWSSAAIAILYHPAAVCIYLAIGIWSFVREWRTRGSLLQIGRELALCHAVPFAFMAWLTAVPTLIE